MTAQVASDEVLRKALFGSEAPTGQVKKRDGLTVQAFDITKIERAVTAAWTSDGRPSRRTCVRRCSPKRLALTGRSAG
jgi:hypothetical protein